MLSTIYHSTLDRHPVIVSLALLGLSVSLTLPHALAKPFWHDEIYTILLSRLPSYHAIWTAGTNGVDLSPPLSLWLTHAVHRVADVGPVSTRLPALSGFYLSVVMVFLLLRRLVGPVGAISGALLLLFTAAPRFAAEARAYGLMLGLFASVLFLWMEVAAGHRRGIYLPMLAMALAASVWNHYYGLLAFAPVVAGEGARMIRRGRPDLAVAAAVGVGLLAIVPLWPLMRVVAAQRHTFWALTSPGEQLTGLYRFLIQPLVDAPFLLAGVLLALLFSRVPWPRYEVPAPALEPHERAAILVALTIPLLGLLLGRLTSGGLVPRYILSGAVAFSLAVPMLVTSRGKRRIAADAVLLGTLAIGAAMSAVGAWYPARRPLTDPALSRALLMSSLRQPGVTVISGSLQFLPLWYYAPLTMQPKLHYLASTHEALRWTRSDTIDRGYQALARTVSLPVVSYETFTSNNKEFRVYDSGSGWLLDALTAAGASVDLQDAEPGGRLLIVRMPDRPDAASPGTPGS